MESSVQSRDASSSASMAIFRWIAFAPAAVVGAVLAWILLYWGNRLTFSMTGINPDAFLSLIFIEGMPYVALGALVVFIGARVAPGHKRVVIFVLAAVMLLFAGFILFAGIMARDGWAIYNAVATAVGAAAVAWFVYSGEVTDHDLGG